MESKSGPGMTKAWSPMIFIAVCWWCATVLVESSEESVESCYGLCLAVGVECGSNKGHAGKLTE